MTIKKITLLLFILTISLIILSGCGEYSEDEEINQSFIGQDEQALKKPTLGGGLDGIEYPYPAPCGACWHDEEGGSYCTGCCYPVRNGCHCWEYCEDRQESGRASMESPHRN